MKIAVRYYSRGGATEKVAKAIAREAGERAETTDRGLDKKVDLLLSEAASTKATLTAM